MMDAGRPKEIDAMGVLTTGRVGLSDTFWNIFSTQAPLKGIQYSVSPYWDQSITKAIKAALPHKTKYLLFYDGDGIWTQQDLFDLHSIIDQDDSIDAVCPVQADRLGPNPLVFNWNAEAFGPYDYQKPIINYPHGHFGLTFIRSRVFEEMPEPWFWSKPANDGSWDLKPGKMDADTWFWLKLHDHHQRTGRRVVQANNTVVGHMELMIRWQVGPDVVCQTVPDFKINGKPYGTRTPTVAEVEKRDAAQGTSTTAPKAVEVVPEPVEVKA